MKRLAKKLSILLVLAIMLTGVFGMPIAAAEELGQVPDATEADVNEEIGLPSQTFEEIIWIDPADYNDAEEIYLNHTFGDIERSSLNSSSRSLDLGSYKEYSANSKTHTPSSRNPFNFIDSIPLAGYYMEYRFNVPSWEMIEAVMYAPEKTPIQYMLALFYWNGSSWVLLDYSDLGTGGGVEFESVGFINTTANQIQFSVRVYTLENGDGNDTYDLTVAIGGGYDNFEWNNSVENGLEYTANIVPWEQELTVNANIRSAVDVDWICIEIPLNASYSTLYFTENNTVNVAYELFELNNGVYSIMSKGNDGEYTVTPGETYYYRISATNAGTTYPQNYTFKLITNIPTASISRSWTINGGAVPTQIYSQGGQRYAFIQSGALNVKVNYYTASGALNFTENDRITVKVIDAAWSNPDLYERSGRAFAQGGIASVPVTIGLVYGQVTVNQQYGFFLYDYSVTYEISSTKYNNVVYISDYAFMTTKIN